MAAEATRFSAPEETFGKLDAAATAGVISAVSDIAVVVDEDGVIRDVSVAPDDEPLLASRAWVGKPWIETVTVESRPKIEELLRDAGKGRTRWRQVNYAVGRGPDVPMLYSAFKVGREGRVVAVGRDLRSIAALQQRLVEAQQSMERDYSRLRSAELRYRMLFQVTREAVLIVDSAARTIVDANPAAAALLEMPARELVGSAFPVGVAATHVGAVETLLANAAVAGRADEIAVDSTVKGRRLLLSASLFRQENAAHFLVRLAVDSPAQNHERSGRASRLLEIIDSIPDGFVVTDANADVLMANRAFLDIAQVVTESQAKGKSLARWLGRPGVDMNVLKANLRQHGSVRLFTTTLRGELGSETDVEMSGVLVAHGDDACYGFTVRNIGRRLNPGSHVVGERVPRSVEELAELIGQVPLRDIVRQTTDLIERLCIETALNLTEDNRASAAEMLGLSRQGLYAKLRRYGLGDLEDVVEE
jgi:transcriptional regulator PpsR